ncbi:hypothetical protein [Streptomyces sp. NBC_00057]|uniref:hypothetical protein n=1 Tax=Streptomyces sp. NBC_00057 TaxID=2975634 RepID=UPI003255FD2B
MATGDFDIFINFKTGMHVDGGLDVEASLDVARVIDGECRESWSEAGARSFSIQGEAATAWVAELTESGEFVLPVFLEHPCDVELRYRADCPNWGDALELARFVFRSLDSLEKYDMFMIHDDEQLVQMNFPHPDFQSLEEFVYW